MPSPADSSASANNLLRRFRRSRGGSAAVEFALVAPMFFALLFAIIETAIMFFANQVLETITQNSARSILTGQTQTAGYTTMAQFQTNVVCPQIPALFTCANVAIDVESWPAFSGSMAVGTLIDGSCNFNNLQYNPGGPGDIVLVKLAYQWPLFVTGLGYNITTPNCTSKRLLVAAAAFKNEPY
ncbi:TadE/TadG family type IV pilus assembly protein [Bradyrhizobium sp. dw_411]|uniref:TadE/TadG family type IV pilus assembly protein n=1 Tax=Bradyrhizobium sp. dw_411 TaxID=2720082 RepID=UPI001BCE46D8|nr:TadE/TadG family type IV pilus assembly protein [Bradyrhizobium sp. dw_411]